MKWPCRFKYIDVDLWREINGLGQDVLHGQVFDGDGNWQIVTSRYYGKQIERHTRPEHFVTSLIDLPAGHRPALFIVTRLAVHLYKILIFCQRTDRYCQSQRKSCVRPISKIILPKKRKFISKFTNLPDKSRSNRPIYEANLNSNALPYS